MLTNQSQVTLDRLVVVEQPGGIDLIVHPISIEYGKHDDQRQWVMEASVYGELNRSTLTIRQYEKPLLQKFSFVDFGFQYYSEVEVELKKKSA